MFGGPSPMMPFSIIYLHCNFKRTSASTSSQRHGSVSKRRPEDTETMETEWSFSFKTRRYQTTATFHLGGKRQPSNRRLYGTLELEGALWRRQIRRTYMTQSYATTVNPALCQVWCFWAIHPKNTKANLPYYTKHNTDTSSVRLRIGVGPSLADRPQDLGSWSSKCSRRDECSPETWSVIWSLRHFLKQTPPRCLGKVRKKKEKKGKFCVIMDENVSLASIKRHRQFGIHYLHYNTQ